MPYISKYIVGTCVRGLLPPLVVGNSIVCSIFLLGFARWFEVKFPMLYSIFSLWLKTFINIYQLLPNRKPKKQNNNKTRTQTERKRPKGKPTAQNQASRADLRTSPETKAWLLRPSSSLSSSSSCLRRYFRSWCVNSQDDLTAKLTSQVDHRHRGCYSSRGPR
jgi:hypothetical protein